MSWIIGRSAGSTQPSLGRVSLSLHSYQNPQFGMTINNIPLLEIKDFGPPARGGHFVLLPPQPYGTQFHTAHSSPVQLVSLAISHVVGRGYKSPLLEITDFVSPTRGGHVVLYVIQRINYFSTFQTSFQIRGMKYLPIQIH